MMAGILLTGGGTGIGRGIALALARRGAKIALVGRRAERLAHTAAEAHALGAECLWLAADLSCADERTRTIAWFHDSCGPLDGLICNAAVFAGGALDGLDGDSIERAIGINLTAPADLVRLALPDLAAQHGMVALIGSTASFVPLPYAALYSATKSGVRALGESLRHELEPRGIGLLMVYPPDTATAMTAGMARAGGAANYAFAPAEAVGARIVDAWFARKRELRWGVSTRAMQALYYMAPGLVNALFRHERARLARMMAAAGSEER